MMLFIAWVILGFAVSITVSCATAFVIESLKKTVEQRQNEKLQRYLKRDLARVYNVQ